MTHEIQRWIEDRTAPMVAMNVIGYWPGSLDGKWDPERYQHIADTPGHPWVLVEDPPFTTTDPRVAQQYFFAAQQTLIAADQRGSVIHLAYELGFAQPHPDGSPWTKLDGAIQVNTYQHVVRQVAA